TLVSATTSTPGSFTLTPSAACASPSTPPFFSTATAATATYTLSLHDALPICGAAPLVIVEDELRRRQLLLMRDDRPRAVIHVERSEEHTSELQSRENLVCRLLLEKKKNNVRSKSPHGAGRHRQTSHDTRISLP